MYYEKFVPWRYVICLLLGRRSGCLGSLRTFIWPDWLACSRQMQCWNNLLYSSRHNDISKYRRRSCCWKISFFQSRAAPLVTPLSSAPSGAVFLLTMVKGTKIRNEFVVSFEYDVRPPSVFKSSLEFMRCLIVRLSTVVKSAWMYTINFF